MNHPDFEAYFEQALKGIPDLDRVLSRIHAKTCKVKDLYVLVSILFFFFFSFGILLVP